MQLWWPLTDQRSPLLYHHQEHSARVVDYRADRKFVGGAARHSSTPRTKMQSLQTRVVLAWLGALPHLADSLACVGAHSQDHSKRTPQPLRR